MPPPPLLRHLRPCHPIGSAHKVRCASRKARPTPATDGDKSSAKESQAATPTADSNAPVVKKKFIWGGWKARRQPSSPVAVRYHDTVTKPKRPVKIKTIEALRSSWLRHRRYEIHVADYVRVLPTMLNKEPSDHKQLEKLQDPREEAFSATWSSYNTTRRRIVLLAKYVNRILPDPKGAEKDSHASDHIINTGKAEKLVQERQGLSDADEVKQVIQKHQDPVNAGNNTRTAEQKNPEAVAADNSQEPISHGQAFADKSSQIQPERAQPPSPVFSDRPNVSVAVNQLPGENFHGSPPTPRDGEQSLLEELFPEVNSPRPKKPVEQKRDDYPKLEPPNLPSGMQQDVERYGRGRNSKFETPDPLRKGSPNFFRDSMEEISVLQLAYCSTELMEVDFVRLIPGGKHIEGWRRGGEFFKIIPGRDPLSMERMPFYYLLFKSPEAALAYQNNAARLHKLCTRHQSKHMLSAVPAPKGFLEDGEDIDKAILSYNLAPTEHPLHLSMLMQPYSPALRSLVEQGGYNPIVPEFDERQQRIWKVLMHIEGYEPSPLDLFKIFNDDAWRHGVPLPLRTESMDSIHRLRDIVNLKIRTKSIASVNPRAAYTTTTPAPQKPVFEDAMIQSLMAGVEEQSSATQINQFVMNRVYNRWVIDFDEETAARRFATHWHRRLLPALARSRGAWEETEEVRICNTELLW